VNLFARLSRWSPVMPLMGRPGARLQPVSVENVARCFAGALTRAETVGQTYDVCGLERLTLEQILDAILAATGRRRWKVHVPLPLARVQALSLEILLGKMLGKPPPLNRDQLRMLQEDNVGDPTTASQTFGLKHKSFGLEVKGWLTAASQ
jgi:NADH dehydrogenase